MADLAKLIRDHAYWADKVRSLKAAGWEAQHQCTTLTRTQAEIDADPSRYNQCGETCIEQAYAEFKAGDKTEYGEYEAYFEYVWSERIHDGKVCERCIEVRKLKAERMAASKRLGSVRAAITRVGRSIATPPTEQERKV